MRSCFWATQIEVNGDGDWKLDGGLFRVTKRLDKSYPTHKCRQHVDQINCCSLLNITLMSCYSADGDVTKNRSASKAWLEFSAHVDTNLKKENGEIDRFSK